MAIELQKFGEKYQEHNNFGERFDTWKNSFEKTEKKLLYLVKEYLHIGHIQETLEKLRRDWQDNLWDNLILPLINATDNNIKKEIEVRHQILKAFFD